MNSVLEDLYQHGECTDLEGQIRKVTGGVTKSHARILQDVIKVAQPVVTSLETGVAFGLSTLAICEALQASGLEGVKHYGIDPEQITVHGGSAIANLRRAGLSQYFELIESPSHLALPKLLEAGTRLDFAFIDGWHTFDYTLLDFFYIDKMLRPGGCVVLHDTEWPSKMKVIGYIMTHRRYRLLDIPEIPGPSWRRRVRGSLLSGLRWVRGAPRQQVFSSMAWLPRIACFQKLEEYEPNYDFFHNF